MGLAWRILGVEAGLHSGDKNGHGLQQDTRTGRFSRPSLVQAPIDHGQNNEKIQELAC